jgi:Domain of unknown function (DUF5666)
MASNSRQMSVTPDPGTAMKRVYLACLLILALGSFASTQNPPANTPAQEQANSPTTTMQTVEPAADDPLLGLPPLPKNAEITLVGGTVASVDRVHNRLSVQPFGGGGRVKFQFDERTHIYRDGSETTQLGMRKGDRVYVDTMLVNGVTFAKNVRVVTQTAAAEARGQLVAYDPATGRMTLREELTTHPVTFRVDQSTKVRRDKAPASATELKPGSLVAVQFSPEGRALGVAHEVTIVAVPGSSFTFAGRVNHLDLRMGTLVLQNQTDSRAYEIHFNPSIPAVRELGVGSEITVMTTFNGTGYDATGIVVNQAKLEQK